MLISPKQPFFVFSSVKFYKCLSHLDYISHFYQIQVNDFEPTVFWAIPDCSVDLIFTSCKNHHTAHVYGSVFKPTKVEFEQGSCCFGVRFRPGALLYFAGIPISEITQKNIPLSNLIKNKFIIENIAFEHNFINQINMFYEYFEQYINAKGHDILNYILMRMFQTSGNIKIDNLSNEMHYSKRYINMIFNNNIGIGPKIFSKALRFNMSFDILNKRNYSNHASIATKLGYYDEAHFLKDFKQFSPVSLKEYIKEINLINYYAKINLVKNNKTKN